MKEETRLEGPWSFGKEPVNRQNKEDWDKVKKAAKEGDFDSIPSDIYVKYYSNLKKIRVDNLSVKNHEECRGVWIWGKPGTGKTTYARTHYGENPYIKA